MKRAAHSLKKPPAKERMLAWFERHNALTCALVGVAAFVAVAGTLAFVVFSGFGSSADFIYNQF